MEEAEFKKIAKPLLRFVEDYTLDLSYRLPKSDAGRSDSKRKKFLVGYADCMYCGADLVKLFIIMPGLDSEKPELVTDHLCNHLRRKEDRQSTILLKFVASIPRIKKEAKL
jgi:hypothetical protein